MLYLAGKSTRSRRSRRNAARNTGSGNSSSWSRSRSATSSRSDSRTTSSPTATPPRTKVTTMILAVIGSGRPVGDGQKHDSVPAPVAFAGALWLIAWGEDGNVRCFDRDESRSAPVDRARAGRARPGRGNPRDHRDAHGGAAQQNGATAPVRRHERRRLRDPRGLPGAAPRPADRAVGGGRRPRPPRGRRVGDARRGAGEPG